MVNMTASHGAIRENRPVSSTNNVLKKAGRKAVIKRQSATMVIKKSDLSSGFIKKALISNHIKVKRFYSFKKNK